MPLPIGIAVCLAYIVGLLLSPVAGKLQIGGFSVPWMGLIGWVLVIVFAAIAPYRFKLNFRAHHWCWLGIVFAWATLYMAIRQPTATPQDISHLVSRVQAIAPTHIITGKVVDEPSLNRDLKGRFPIIVTQLQAEEIDGQLTFDTPTMGKVYVTAPLLQITGLHKGQWIKAKGQLYLPQSAMNPNGFDFQAYLSQQGIFAGFVAEELRFSEAREWGLWHVRQRIVRAQVRALGSPLGQLVSAMALGRKAVDLPFDIQDLFSRVGLAHTIAASGFHVSLLLGSVLALVRSRSAKVQLVSGLTVLGLYVTLTGLQASVVRAALMGVAMLIGLVLERRVKPLATLLLAVTLMLIINPNWLWNIGFQLSVVATLGLIVAVPGITRKLDWLPPSLSSLVAVPIAATLWTLPLTLYHFNVISGLSIGLNAIATPLVTLISLGGITSSALALLSPTVGSWAAQLLYFPVHGLLWLARTSSQLPGSAITIGQINLWQLIGLYGILTLSTGLIALKRLQPLLPIAFLALIWVPIGWQVWAQSQITVLAAGDELVWLFQNHGRATLVNSGSEKTAFYTVQPFLKQAGVNRLERAIALPFEPDYPAGWQTLLRAAPSPTLYANGTVAPLANLKGNYYPLQIGQTHRLQDITLQLLGTENPILRLTTAQTSWLLLPELSIDLQTYLASAGTVLQSQVLVWNGDELSAALLAAVQPEVVVCYGRTLSEALERQLQQANIQVFWTMREGAVIWQSRTGFHSYLATKHRSSLPWG